MATPNTPDPEPIIFTGRGLVIDTRLRVFDKVFHVHSTILRLHSQYFFKFLDSADKVEGTSSGSFKYDWVTKIVDDGEDWQLVCAGPNAGDLNLAQWKNMQFQDPQAYDLHMLSEDSRKEQSVDVQTKAFHAILKAMYTLPYDLHFRGSLVVMTKLARFYMCLSLISRTLDGALARSQNFWSSTRLKPEDILTAAVELSHKVLFHDALIWVLGPYTFPRCHKIADKKLFKMAQSHYHKLRSMISSESQTIIEFFIYGGGKTDGKLISYQLKHGMAAELSHAGDDFNHHLCLPRLFREIFKVEIHEYCPFKESLERVLVNDIKIGSDIEGAGTEYWPDHFFLSTIEDDDDYPWDTTALDW